jgi:hypothetical protein
MCWILLMEMKAQRDEDGVKILRSDITQAAGRSCCG